MHGTGCYPVSVVVRRENWPQRKRIVDFESQTAKLAVSTRKERDGGWRGKSSTSGRRYIIGIETQAQFQLELVVEQFGVRPSRSSALAPATAW